MSQSTSKKDTIEKAKSSILRITEFNNKDLVRMGDLGAKGAFHDAVEPADRLKVLFSRVPLESLNEFPESELNLLIKNADSVFNLYTQILEFDTEAGEISARRDQIISHLVAQYQPAFSALMPLVSYAVARTIDWDQLAADGRAAVQSVRDEADAISKELKATSDEATRVLQEVRDAAAEQGVTQQAKFFEAEATIHATSAENWLVASVICAVAVVAYAISTLFFPTIGWFQAETTSEAIQLTVSKVLVFLVLSFTLIQTVKIYMSHRHNAVVNKHRQNALLTYTNLADAGASVEARDTVLQHAAAAIYSPVDTGYIKSEERGYGVTPAFSVAPRSISGGSPGE